MVHWFNHLLTLWISSLDRVGDGLRMAVALQFARTRTLVWTSRDEEERQVTSEVREKTDMKWYERDER